MHMYRQADKQAYRLIIRNMFVYHVCILCLKQLDGLHNLVDYLWLNEFVSCTDELNNCHMIVSIYIVLLGRSNRSSGSRYGDVHNKE